MNTNLHFWILISILGVLTFFIRGSFLVAMSNQKLHPKLLLALKFIPTSVLAALALPAVFLVRSNSVQLTEVERWIAGSIALLVAWYSKNILATILSGMITLWLVKYMLS